MYFVNNISTWVCFLLQIQYIVALIIKLYKNELDIKKRRKIKELWKKGHSASQIASMLGDTTRNAVIGKAHRLNLEARATSKKSNTKIKFRKIML